MSNIKKFTDLETWKEGHKLVLEIYTHCRKFPREERFTLTDQIKRAAISVTSNIAEGFSRQSKKEKRNFYYIAKGSLTELQNQLLIAKDVEYISKEEFEKTAEQSKKVFALLNGLIRAAKNNQP